MPGRPTAIGTLASPSRATNVVRYARSSFQNECPNGVVVESKQDYKGIDLLRLADGLAWNATDTTALQRLKSLSTYFR